MFCPHKTFARQSNPNFTDGMWCECKQAYCAWWNRDASECGLLTQMKMRPPAAPTRINIIQEPEETL